MFHVTDE